MGRGEISGCDDSLFCAHQREMCPVLNASMAIISHSFAPPPSPPPTHTGSLCVREKGVRCEMSALTWSSPLCDIRTMGRDVAFRAAP